MKKAGTPLPRLAFGNADAHESGDLDAFADAQRAVMPAIRGYESCGARRAFRHRSSTVRVGSVTLVASASTPVSVSVDDAPGTTLLVPWHGWNTSVIGGREHRWQAGESAMFVPGTRREGRSGVRSLLAIGFDPVRVAATAASMSGAGDRAVRNLDLRTPRAIPLAASRSPAMAMLRQVLPLVDLAGGDEDALRLVGLEDTLFRFLVLLLAPELLGSATAGPRCCRSTTALRRATDHIVAGLPGAIALADLERVSGLSARSLQLAFRREYGLSPRDWIRERRLLLARERIQRAAPGETVTGIALACGFARLGAFAAAYAARFGESPSATLARRLRS